MNEERKQAVAGSLWTIFGYGASQAFRLISNLLLAHFLFPAAFGLMALVIVVMQGLQMFSNLGIGPAIIQNPRGEEPAFLRTAFTIQAIRGFFLWIVSCVIAWPVSVFFSQRDPLGEQLLTMLPVVGISAAIAGLNSTSVFTLNRRLKFGHLTLLELVPQFIALAVQVIWAWLYPTVWALVGGWILSSMIKMVMSHWMNLPRRDGFGWDRECARQLAGFGVWIFFSTILSFLANSLDRILLGKLLTMAELGVYSISVNFARLAFEMATRLANVVIFPILSRYQKEPAVMVQKCYRARELVLLAGGAVCSAFAIFAPIFFGRLYDERYAAAGEISRWVAILIWSQIMLCSIERAPLALGHSKALFIINCIVTSSYGLAVPGYFLFGLKGFLIGLALGHIVAHGVAIGWLPVGKRKLLLQSGLLSLFFGIYTLVAITVHRRFLSDLNLWVEGGVVGVLAGVPCLVVGAFVFTKFKTLKSQK